MIQIVELRGYGEIELERLWWNRIGEVKKLKKIFKLTK